MQHDVKRLESDADRYQILNCIGNNELPMLTDKPTKVRLLLCCLKIAALLCCHCRYRSSSLYPRFVVLYPVIPRSSSCMILFTSMVTVQLFYCVLCGVFLRLELRNRGANLRAQKVQCVYWVKSWTTAYQFWGTERFPERALKHWFCVSFLVLCLIFYRWWFRELFPVE